MVRDSAHPDRSYAYARQLALQDLPEDTLVFLLGSRYCETDLLSGGGLGPASADRRPAGRECRPSAILSTTISLSTINTRAPLEPRGRL